MPCDWPTVSWTTGRRATPGTIGVFPLLGQQPAQPADAALDEQLEVHRAGLVFAEAVVEGVVDPVEAQERRAPPVGSVQKRAMFAAVIRRHVALPFTFSTTVIGSGARRA